MPWNGKKLINSVIVVYIVYEFIDGLSRASPSVMWLYQEFLEKYMYFIEIIPFNYVSYFKLGIYWVGVTTKFELCRIVNFELSSFQQIYKFDAFYLTTCISFKKYLPN